MSSQVRLGVVQPRTYWGAEERRNLDEALKYVAQGAALGAVKEGLLRFPAAGFTGTLLPGEIGEKTQCERVRLGKPQDGVAKRLRFDTFRQQKGVGGLLIEIADFQNLAFQICNRSSCNQDGP